MSRMDGWLAAVLLGTVLLGGAAAGGSANPLRDFLAQQQDPPSRPSPTPELPQPLPSREDPQPTPSPREAMPDRTAPDDVLLDAPAQEPPLLLVLGALALLASVVTLLLTYVRSRANVLAPPEGSGRANVGAHREGLHDH